MLGRIFRVLSGFILACLVAGLVKVFFAFPPGEPGSPTGELDRLFALAMPIATHTAIFAAPFALVAIAVAEWQRWRDWAYYAAAAIGISMIGFFAQYQSETATQGWSIGNSSYPLIAFLTTGFLGGLAYWLLSGRHAGHHLLTTHGRQGLGGHSDHRTGGDRSGGNNAKGRA